MSTSWSALVRGRGGQNAEPVAQPIIYLAHSGQSPHHSTIRLRRQISSVETPLRWLFLGQDFRIAQVWERALGADFQRIDIGRLLNDTAHELRQPFNSWVDELNVRYGADPHWWFTRISERNTQVSSFFLSICHLAVAKHCLLGESPPHLIVVQGWGLIESLHVLGKTLGLDFQVMSPWRKYVHAGKQGLWMLALLGYFLATAIRNQAAAWVTRRGRTSFAPNSGPRCVLLETFFHESNLSPDGVFRDRYFPFLHEWLATQGVEVWILPTVVDRRSSILSKYRWMRKSSAHFLIPEDWLTVNDYVDALWCGLKAWWWPRNVEPVHGLDIRFLVYAERWEQGASLAPRRACLLSRIPIRLRQTGFRPDHVIDWSENQVYDKAFVIGCRRAFPDAVCTAVQNTPLYPNLLNLFPTAVECQLKVTADRQVCGGPLVAQILAEQSHGQLHTIIGCSLRYDYLWRIIENQGQSSPLQQSRAVLVGLPMSMSVAVDILDLIAPLCLERRSLTWYIKPHPDNAIEDLKRIVSTDVLEHVIFIEGLLGDWIDKVSLVITSASGVGLEAAALGIPVILIGSRTTLNYDPLVWFNGAVGVTCYSCEEVGRELDRIAAFTTDDYAALRQRGRQVLDAWFSPVTEDGLRQFLV